MCKRLGEVCTRCLARNATCSFVFRLTLVGIAVNPRVIADLRPLNWNFNWWIIFCCCSNSWGFQTATFTVVHSTDCQFPFLHLILFAHTNLYIFGIDLSAFFALKSTSGWIAPSNCHLVSADVSILRFGHGSMVNSITPQAWLRSRVPRDSNPIQRS